MNYGLNLNTKRQNAIALLALATPESFPRIRQKILLAVAGGRSGDPRDCISEILGRHRMAPAQRTQLTRELVRGTITPYEAVGILKDGQKKMGNSWSGKSMTETWTTLSMAVALLEPSNNPILDKSFDFERALAEQSILPKTKQLEKSYNEAPVDGRYHTTRPYLADSTKKNPNWAEILGNLPEGAATAALELLKCDPAKPNIKSIASKLLWPETGPAECENRRLNAFLESLPARPRGRARIAGTKLEANPNRPESVEAPKLEASRKQIKRKKELEIDYSAALAGKGGNMNLLLRLGEMVNRSENLHPDHQKELENRVFEVARKCEPPQNYSGVASELWALANNKAAPGQARFFLPNRTGKLRDILFLEVAKETPDSPVVAQYLAEGIGQKTLEEAAKHSPQVEAHIKKSLEPVRGKMAEGGAARAVLGAALEGKKLDPGATYGKTKNTLVHIAAWWRDASVLEEALLARKEKGLPPLPENSRGSTPAFFCKDPAKAGLLEKYPMNTSKPNEFGKTVETTSPSLMDALHEKKLREQAARRLIKQETLEM